MDFHYPLVADLIGREEFGERVERLISASGGLLDEETASMLLVRELGRGHVKIAAIPPGAHLCCLFAKVLAIEEPVRFTRRDGEETVRSSLLVGDETGHLRILFWGERAGAVREVEEGEVLEIVGRPARSRRDELHVVAMRRTSCEIGAIPLSGVQGAGEEAEREIEVRLLALGPPREFLRRNGERARMAEGLAGNREGTFRFVCWAPEILEGVTPPCSLVLRGVKVREGAYGTEYHLDAGGSVAPCEGEVELPLTPLREIVEGGYCSVAGEIRELEEPVSFLSQKGQRTWRRSLILSDSSGEARILLWDEHARIPLAPGERVVAYHLLPRRGREGRIELSMSRAGHLGVVGGVTIPLVLEGVVIPGHAGQRLETPGGTYLLSSPLPPGAYVRVEGRADGRRLFPVRWEMLAIDAEGLGRRLDALLESLR